MSWEKNEQTLCRLIHDRISAASAQDEKFEEFQGFVKVVKAFERAGLIESLRLLPETITGRNYVHHASWKIPASDVTTVQRQWLILRFFGTKARENESQHFQPSVDTFAGLAGSQSEINRACDHLKKSSYIEWTPGYGCGIGMITDLGVEASEHGIEALRTPPPSAAIPPIVIHQNDNRNQSISVGSVNSGGGDVALGHHATINKEVLTEELSKLILAIQQAPGTKEEKLRLVGHLKTFLMHPLVANLLGGGILASIGMS